MQGFYRHDVDAIGSADALLRLPAAAGGTQAACRCSIYLAGLTCTEETFTDQGRRAALRGRARADAGRARHQPARHATSRATTTPGTSASAPASTSMRRETPWAAHYRMYSYVTRELPALIAAQLPGRPDAPGHLRPLDGRPRRADAARCAIPAGTGRSRPSRRSARPPRCPWGEKAFSGYLGADRTAWADLRRQRAAAPRRRRAPQILVDQGIGDQFLAEQLQAGAARAGLRATPASALTLRRQPGYDHCYYFIQTFMADHVAHPCDRAAPGLSTKTC